MLDTKKILAANLSALLDSRPDISRLNLSKQIKVADGTLGRIKYGTGNPTIEVLEQIASFFRVEAWQLLTPDLGKELLQKPPTPEPAQNEPYASQLKAAGAAIQSGSMTLEAVMAGLLKTLVDDAVSAERTRWEQERRKAG